MAVKFILGHFKIMNMLKGLAVAESADKTHSAFDEYLK